MFFFVPFQTLLFVHHGERNDKANETFKLTIPATTPQNLRVPAKFHVENKTFLYLRQPGRFCEVVEVNDAQPQVESEAAAVKGEGPPAVPVTEDKKPHDRANDSWDGEADHVSVESEAAEVNVRRERRAQLRQEALEREQVTSVPVKLFFSQT